MLRRTTTAAATETLRAVRSVGWGPGATTTATATTRGAETALFARNACAPTRSREFQSIAAAATTTSGARVDRRDALWTHPAQMVARRGWKRANRRVEVILKESIEGLGQADEVVRVRPGRARNHLVPERLATYVNAEKLAAAQERLARREEERAESEEDEESEAVSAAEAERARKAQDLVMKMLTADPPIVFKRIIDKNSGKPRLPVTRENIVEEIRRQKKFDISPSSLVIDRSIEEYGEYEIPLWVRGYPRGAYALPLIVRKRL